MKKIILLLFAVAISITANAQIKTPAASPAQKIEQTVGLTDVTLEYSRPHKKDREIFGGLVPFNKVWRTGANKNSQITFSDDVEIGGTSVKAGTYAIFTKPGEVFWEVSFYSDASNWGTPGEWDASKVAAMVKVESIEMPMTIQSFTMMFNDVTSDSVELGIMWDKTYVPVTINFGTDKAVTASIDQLMSGPSSRDYYSAAVFYLESGKDIDKAKTWIDKAIESSDEPQFWVYRQKSLIYAKSGDKKGAIKAAKMSLSLAKEAGNDDYVAMNTNSLSVWEGKTVEDK
jgi:tetratricopeptide (TPR) repeat protein